MSSNRTNDAVRTIQTSDNKSGTPHNDRFTQIVKYSNPYAERCNWSRECGAAVPKHVLCPSLVYWLSTMSQSRISLPRDAL